MQRLLGVEGFNSGAIMMTVNGHAVNVLGLFVEFNDDDLRAASLHLLRGY